MTDRSIVVVVLVGESLVGGVGGDGVVCEDGNLVLRTIQEALKWFEVLG